MSQAQLSVVIPTFNEEGNIKLLYEQLKKVLELNSIIDFEIIFVDDGSVDDSLLKIIDLSEQDARIKFISFSKNFGHQYALKAGLDYAFGKMVVSMDADMQHPPQLIPTLINEWKNGNKIVYTIREKEEGLSLLKKWTSKGFYWLINILSEHPIIDGAADFRLLDQRVVEVLRTYHEKELFFRGLISGLGFKQKAVYFQPNKRFSGATKYSIKKMARLAIAGITSASAKPLYFSIYLGAFMAFLAFVYGVYAIWIEIFTDKAILGWTSIIASIVFIGGIQLIVMGIIGVYLAKVFKESKNRPLYIIDQTNIKEANA